MKKKALLNLTIIKERNDIPVMQHIDKITQKTSYGDYTYNAYNYCYDAFIDSSTGEEVLIIDVFTPAPQSEFKYRLFQTMDKWFLVDNENKLSERSLSPNSFYRTENFHPFNEETNSIIDEYINKSKKLSFYIKDKGIMQISNLQDGIRKQRLKDKYNKIKESVSLEMLKIRPLPKNFEKWITDTVMAESRYLFYDATRKKKTIARCSHCGETVIIDTPKRDTKAICPCCKSSCIAKPYKAWYNSNGFTDVACVKYLQPLKNNSFCIRSFSVSWGFQNITRPWKIVTETDRSFINIEYGILNTMSYYQYEPSYQGGDWRKYFSSSNYDSVAHIYPSTLNKIFKTQENFKKFHINFNRIAKCCNPISVLGLYKSVNEVEFVSNLVNNKLSNLARSIINGCGSHSKVTWLNSIKGFDITKGSLRKGCGITKDELPFFKKLNPDLNEFEMLDTCKSLKKLSDESTMKGLFRIRKLAGMSLNQFKKILRHSSVNQFVKYFSYLERTYFKNRRNEHWQNPYYYFVLDYLDYIDNAVLLEYNLKNRNVLYPKDFKNAHDTVYKIVNDKSFKNAELPQIARQYKDYDALFSFVYKDLLIRPPKSHNEVKQEGEKLSHCVASYAKDIATGNTIILFIRKVTEPDIPYFTLNLDPSTLEIIQNRGYRNCSYPQSVKSFMDKWYSEKIKPIKRSREKCQKTTAA